MSHHIDVDFMVLPPGKKPVSKKLQDKSPSTASAKKRESKKLEIDNKQMEWRLLQLKKAMEKEKEERGGQGYIWKSGKAVNLESHARNTLGHSVKTTKTPHAPVKPKVKVLKDEPLDIRQRKNHTQDLIDNLKIKEPLIADLPRQQEATPIVNQETWISVALEPHSEEVMEMQSDPNGNLPLACLAAIEPMSIGLYYKKWGRKRLILAIDGKMFKPKQGWGSEVYYPYIGNVSPQRTNVMVSPTKESPKTTPTKQNTFLDVKKGGRLLEGAFNEEQSAQSFKNAIAEWRQKHGQDQISDAAPVEMSVHAVQSDPTEIEINFSETTTLSFMERLLLKKHRTSEVPPLLTPAKYEDNQVSEDLVGLTEQELDDHNRIREMFTPQTRSESVSTIEMLEGNITPQPCIITELPADDCWNDEECDEGSSVRCFVDEAEDDTEVAQPKTSVSSVSIEECTFTELKPECMSDEHEQKFVSPEPSKHLNSTKVTNTPKRPSGSKSAVFHRKLVQNPKVQVKEETRPKTSCGIKVSCNDVQSSYDDLLHVVSTLPLNPDAFYHNDLGDFFSDIAKQQCLENDNTNLPKDLITSSKGPQLWEPLSSLVISENEVTNEPFFQETHDKTSNLQDELEKADANALDALEWELASQTGNLTSDGRISRLIDDWSSEEEDLGIINDPGLGSGLSSPEVDQRSHGSTIMQSTTWQEEENLLHDFEQMEQFMMGDLNNESDSEENSID